MTAPADKKREARRRYVIERQSLGTIAAALGVSEGTVSRWKREAKSAGDDWQIRREAHLVAGEGLESVVSAVAEDLVMLSQAVIRDVKAEEDMPAAKKAALLASVADAMGKAVSCAGRLAPKISEFGVAQDVIQRLGSFVGQEFPEHAPAFLEILEPFAASLAKAYGET